MRAGVRKKGLAYLDGAFAQAVTPDTARVRLAPGGDCHSLAVAMLEQELQCDRTTAGRLVAAWVETRAAD